MKVVLPKVRVFPCCVAPADFAACVQVQPLLEHREAIAGLRHDLSAAPAAASGSPVKPSTWRSSPLLKYRRALRVSPLGVRVDPVDRVDRLLGRRAVALRAAAAPGRRSAVGDGEHQRFPVELQRELVRPPQSG